MIDIKKLGLPVFAIIPLLLSAATIGGTYATTKATLAEHEKSDKEQEKEIAVLKKESTDTKVNQAVMSTKIDSIGKAIDRLEDRFGTKPR